MKIDFNNLEWGSKPSATKAVTIAAKRAKAIKSKGTRVFLDTNGVIQGTVKYGTEFIKRNGEAYMRMGAMNTAEFDKAEADIRKQLYTAITQGVFDTEIEAISVKLSGMRKEEAFA
jgi:hypothetical protein